MNHTLTISQGLDSPTTLTYTSYNSYPYFCTRRRDTRLPPTLYHAGGDTYSLSLSLILILLNVPEEADEEYEAIVNQRSKNRFVHLSYWFDSYLDIHLVNLVNF